MEIRMSIKKTTLVAIVSGLLAGCQSVESQRIDISGYSPVIDYQAEGISAEQFAEDLSICRGLGQQVQVTYEEQRKKEQGQAARSAVIGALVGAAIGQTVAKNNDVHSGRALTTGTLYGAAVGGAVGSEAVDYDRTLTKFGPTGIVDRCMAQRGYNVLSAEGFGGG
jgi:uncharacterized protein YcfJ